MKKKWFIRAAVMLGVCVATLLIAAPAMAMWDWCDIDPVVSIGGHTVSLDAAFQGDPQQIRGDIVFSITVPKGTQVHIISCEPNAEVKINYNNGNGNDCNNGNNGNDRSSFRQSSRGIPVAVSVDINTRTTFNTRLTVSLDGTQIDQEQGTTRHDLESDFSIK
jgi:hypothetical protein